MNTIAQFLAVLGRWLKVGRNQSDEAIPKTLELVK